MSKNNKSTPDTVVGDEGSAKRNILRKSNKGKLNIIIDALGTQITGFVCVFVSLIYVNYSYF